MLSHYVIRHALTPSSDVSQFGSSYSFYQHTVTDKKGKGEGRVVPVLN